MYFIGDELKDTNCDGCSAPITRLDPVFVVVGAEETLVLCQRCDTSRENDDKEEL